MNNEPDIYRRLANLIRAGVVHEVRHSDPPRCRVSTGDLVTGWLPWLELRAGTSVTWNPPTVGEQCLVFCPDGNTAAGVVLVGMYQDNRPAPGESPDEHLQRYPDGARIDYNHASSKLVIDVPGSGSIYLRCGDSSIRMTGQAISLNSPRIDLDY